MHEEGALGFLEGALGVEVRSLGFEMVALGLEVSARGVETSLFGFCNFDLACAMYRSVRETTRGEPRWLYDL